MEDISLHGPRSKVLCFDLRLYRNGYVLMPGDFPVGIRNFVEENTANGKAIDSKNGLNQRLDCRGTRQFVNLWNNLKEIAHCKNSTTLLYRYVVRNTLQPSQQRGQSLVRNNAINDCESIAINRGFQV